MAKKKIKEIKKALRKVWWFIWESNSIWSWIVNIILAFVIIKFLIYPGLGFMLGTTHPVVAVISSSMEHPYQLDEWWSSKCCPDLICSMKVSQEELYTPYLITQADFKLFPFKKGFNKGDMMVLAGAKDVKIGDIIVFNADHRKDPIIHRIVNINESSYTTKGDNNCGSWDFEHNIPKEKVIGRAVIRIPFLGWIKIGFMNLLRLIGIGG